MGSVRFANLACPVRRRKRYDPRQKRPKIKAPRAASRAISIAQAIVYQ
jgi:hypothetical protein